jgi:hypothetical protein
MVKKTKGCSNCATGCSARKIQSKAKTGKKTTGK